MTTVPVRPTDVRELSRHVLFRAAGRRFALPLAQVREVVVPPPSFVRVPRAPPFVRGVMNLRGRVVTAIDFARLVELGDEVLGSAATRILLLEGGVRDLGILVGEVAGIAALPDPGSPPPGARPEVAGLATHEDEAVTLLSAERLLASIDAAFPGAKHV